MKHKNSNSKNVVIKNTVVGTTQMIIGYIIAIIFGLLVVAGSVSSGFETTFDVVMVSILSAISLVGISIITRGAKRKKLAKLFMDYSARLSADSVRSIEKLASATGSAMEFVLRNIEKMISMGYFVNAYIDYDRKRLVFAYEKEQPDSKPDFEQHNAASIEYCSVTCHGCGAKNKVQKRTVGKCEFCGSYLSEASNSSVSI